MFPRNLFSAHNAGWTGDQHLKKELGSLSGVMDSLRSEHLFEEHFTGKLHRHRASLRSAQTLFAWTGGVQLERTSKPPQSPREAQYHLSRIRSGYAELCLVIVTHTTTSSKRVREPDLMVSRSWGSITTGKNTQNR